MSYLMMPMSTVPEQTPTQQEPLLPVRDVQTRYVLLSIASDAHLSNFASTACMLRVLARQLRTVYTQTLSPFETASQP